MKSFKNDEPHSHQPKEPWTQKKPLRHYAFLKITRSSLILTDTEESWQGSEYPGILEEKHMVMLLSKDWRRKQNEKGIKSKISYSLF